MVRRPKYVLLERRESREVLDVLLQGRLIVGEDDEEAYGGSDKATDATGEPDGGTHLCCLQERSVRGTGQSQDLSM